MKVLWSALAAISAVMAIQSLYVAMAGDRSNRTDALLNVAIFSIAPICWLVIRAIRRPITITNPAPKDES